MSDNSKLDAESIARWVDGIEKTCGPAEAKKENRDILRALAEEIVALKKELAEMKAGQENVIVNVIDKAVLEGGRIRNAMARS